MRYSPALKESPSSAIAADETESNDPAKSGENTYCIFTVVVECNDQTGCTTNQFAGPFMSVARLVGTREI